MKVILLIALCAVAVMASPAVRQSGNTCTSSSDCVPASIFNETNGTVPQALIACNTNTGVCVCSDCFMLNATANQCYLMPPCTDFDVARMECQDTRRKQLTAFLLAFFLTTFGAANFYVDRLEFAIPQLILGIIFICCSCANTCTRQCAKDSDNTTLKVGLCCIVGLPTCILSFLFLAWWIADLVIFGTNARDDGSGCPLIDNL